MTPEETALYLFVESAKDRVSKSENPKTIGWNMIVEPDTDPGIVKDILAMWEEIMRRVGQTFFIEVNYIDPDDPDGRRYVNVGVTDNYQRQGNGKD